MEQEKGYRCPYTGEALTIDQLDGYGQPPRSPNCPDGLGSGSPMMPCIVKVDRDDGGVVVKVRHVRDGWVMETEKEATKEAIK